MRGPRAAPRRPSTWRGSMKNAEPQRRRRVREVGSSAGREESRREVSSGWCGREAGVMTPGNYWMSSQEVPSGSARSLQESVAGGSYCAAGLQESATQTQFWPVGLGICFQAHIKTKTSNLRCKKHQGQEPRCLGPTSEILLSLTSQGWSTL